MTPFSTLVDTCNPSLPGCQPENYAPALVGSLLVILAFLLIIAGVIVLVIVLIVRTSRRGNVSSQGASEVPGTSTVGQALPGWFADPTKRFQWRWWDGSNWTETVSDGGPPQIDRGDATR